MRKIILSAAALVFSSVVYAEGPAKDGVAILTEQQNGNYLLGRMFLTESDKSAGDTDNDTFALPECGSGANVAIDGLRLNAPKNKPNGNKNLDALIKKIVIVFGNGGTKTVNPTGDKAKLTVTNNSGDGMTVVFESPRCVRAVTVMGEQFEKGNNASESVVNVVGVIKDER